MIKHFCDICGKKLSGINYVDNVTLLTDLIETQFATMPSHSDNCELCVPCAYAIIRTIDMMKKGKEVIYK